MPEDERRQAIRREARDHYVGDLDGASNDVTRIDLILGAQSVRAGSMDDLERIEQAVRDGLPADTAEA